MQSIYEIAGVARHLREGRRGRFRTVRSRGGGRVIGFWEWGRGMVFAVFEYHSFIGLSCKTLYLYLEQNNVLRSENW